MSRCERARSWPRLLTAVLIGLVAGILCLQAEAAPREQTRDRVNANTVTILSGNPNGTYLYIAAELPNWQRSEPAAKWLRDNRIAANSGNHQFEKQFTAFIAASGAAERTLSEAEKRVLFQQFMEWRNAGARLTAAN